ncbi:excinuclease ABC subunit UvrB [Mesoplasma lactucae]|uniref:UvrABC system protein B n=1 Tax=Mesoplasma lactucae ATCC 49193 TaxID=81460 RepID=A0A291ISD3_9MOLU|nr:excinuclease ABC subunit UvrB [Mesoplasma lactucae]ATG97644.1 excinuclease ABC subunit B [Mesoplasma lactucae ATCC 49193]ATZ19893.1 excinuclease ABC subunit B [Mesoplasma lactucae ATCC 49193]MCL8216756.1 UvrABC system protein B [Mesoplasma lactucae ATCC 49193]
MEIKREPRKFELHAPFEPSGDQPQAIKELTEGLNEGKKDQVLLGATGTGKTFTMANLIANQNKPTLVLAHNKTLAMQLYYELKEFFPNNRVEYFVSNFDFYQPEAYVPSKDLYIDKDARQNMELDMMRLSAMNALMTRNDTIVVASVASIYAIQNPAEYSKSFFELNVGQKISRKEILTYLVKTGYTRNDIEMAPGTFSAKGDVIKIVPGWQANIMFRVSLFGDEIESIDVLDATTGSVTGQTRTITIYPAQAYVTPEDKLGLAVANIRAELAERLKYFRDKGLMLEAQRLEQRTNYDMESLTEFGYCSGIENYSSHLDFRKPGQMPYALIDYFGDDFLTIIDESHMMIPQIRGMYNTDRSRKTTLIDYGFRLPSAIDNRPLSFDEFRSKMKQVVYTSATPGDYELDLTDHKVVQQVIRPTGLLDPIIDVRKTDGQIDDLIEEIRTRKEKGERTLITTLTIRMSEDLTAYLQEKGIKVAYLHSELKTFERSEIINDLRKGVYDAVVGVNLLREGLDIPEVSLVAVLDADKQGFLRNTRSLVQTAGRAARNAHGEVIFYADTISPAMKEAMEETSRRREVQEVYNKEHNITPKTVFKKVQDSVLTPGAKKELDKVNKTKDKDKKRAAIDKLLADLRKEMLQAAKDLDFEKAADLRDTIIDLEGQKD